MIYLDGVAGWACPACKKRNPSRVIVCNCGETHRPTEFFLREERDLRNELRALRFWLVTGWALAVAAAGIALALWWALNADFHTKHTENTKGVGFEEVLTISRRSEVPSVPTEEGQHHEKPLLGLTGPQRARGAAAVAVAAAGIPSDGREKAQKAQGTQPQITQMAGGES